MGSDSVGKANTKNRKHKDHLNVGKYTIPMDPMGKHFFFRSNKNSQGPPLLTQKMVVVTRKLSERRWPETSKINV